MSPWLQTQWHPLAAFIVSNKPRVSSLWSKCQRCRTPHRGCINIQEVVVGAVPLYCCCQTRDRSLLALSAEHHQHFQECKSDPGGKGWAASRTCSSSEPSWCWATVLKAAGWREQGVCASQWTGGTAANTSQSTGPCDALLLWLSPAGALSMQCSSTRADVLQDSPEVWDLWRLLWRVSKAGELPCRWVCQLQQGLQWCHQLPPPLFWNLWHWREDRPFVLRQLFRAEQEQICSMVFLVVCDEGSSHRGDHELHARWSHKVHPRLVFWTAQAMFQTSWSLLLERPLCVVTESTPAAKVNILQLVGREDGTVHVNTYNWQTYLAPVFKPLHSIKKTAHFWFSAYHFGQVFYKASLVEEESWPNLLKNRDAFGELGAMPDIIPAPGLPRERQQYLFCQIREFVREDQRDVVYPNPGN